ncbi:chaperone NapD [Helicobacter sp. MIT 14-3879]|uniref:chaperone NapD n=1 Tax=Helicobacter sp. MIT 14-3879 TaxID=2040649 RepID=UPI000E1E6AE6|nr:chaperone NapD [Helicobacter sp. MIT 14-3879]RDU63477.1 nitrate reductase [Helicobacter sp. MIT 14-3879]
MNISSIIIKVLPKNLQSTSLKLSKIDGVEVALKENNTIIVVIEAEDTNKEVEILRKIEQTNGVISASMHYSYFEDSLRDEISSMNSNLDILNDDKISIEEVKYTGSINYMMNRKNK